MANEFITAIGLSYLQRIDDDDRKPPSVIATVRRINPSYSIQQATQSNKGYLVFESYEKAEVLIKDLYTNASNLNNNISEEEKLRFHVVVTTETSVENIDKNLTARFFEAVGLLISTMEKPQDQITVYPIQIYITGEVYKGLPPSYRDLYHSSTEIAGNIVHQRFSEDAQRCFVVSPIGKDGDPIRARADHIFEKYIKPACESTPFRAVRGDMLQGNRITPEVEEALQSDPMVIVYLGNPKWNGWNANVMYELGIRSSTSYPYVVIKDSTSNEKHYDLPFDIKDNRIVDVPENEADYSGSAATKIRTIREMIDNGKKENPWNYLYPGATIDMKIGEPSSKESRFIDASSDLEALFELKGIVSKGLGAVIDHLLKKMPLVQRQPFLDEQYKLIAQLVVPPIAQPDVGDHVHNILPKAYATVPMIFHEHQQYKGQAFLPIIVRYHFNKLTNILKLRVLYVEVTSTTRLLAPGGHYVCILHGNGKVDLA